MSATNGTAVIVPQGSADTAVSTVSGGKVGAAAGQHGGDAKTRAAVEAARRVLAVRALSLPTLNCINTGEVIEKRPVVEGLLYPGAWLVVGRRGGKSMILAIIAVTWQCSGIGSRF